MNTQEILFSLLRFELFGEELNEETKNLITPEIFSGLYKLSKAHDLVHLIGDALDKNGFLSENTNARNAFLKQRSMAVYRYEQIQYELEEICAAFEDAKIEHIPLKGSVLRRYYPEPWMRTSSDIDILVRNEDLDRATKIVCDVMHYEIQERNAYNFSMFAENGVHLELHYNLTEDTVSPESVSIFENIWDMTLPVDGFQYRKELTIAAFYFYHISHMAKHFVHGGCGIRPFLDLKILHDNALYNESCSQLLKKGNLFAFAKAARTLAFIWFENEKYTSVTCDMEDYVLQGGVYGTFKNKLAVEQTKKGGRLHYALSRIFLPYEVLKKHYPSLEKHKWLFPFFQVRRWFKLLFKGGIKRSAHELSVNASITNDQQARTRALLENLGL